MNHKVTGYRLHIQRFVDFLHSSNKDLENKFLKSKMYKEMQRAKNG